MLFILTLILLATAIVVFFADELERLTKKILTIKVTQLIFPLLIASWLIEQYQSIGIHLLFYLKHALYWSVHQLSGYFPFKSHYATSLSYIIHLLVIASMPICFIYKASKKTGPVEKWHRAYWWGVGLWVVFVVLLTVPHPSLGA